MNNNNKLYPFERNRYYPGKMLTSADFQAEQNYHINKVRFLNGLMYGSGIVCGLGVFSLDDQSVLIESGAAIDGHGREIIVDSSTLVSLFSFKTSIETGTFTTAGITLKAVWEDNTAHRLMNALNSQANGVAQLDQHDIGELGAASNVTIYASSVLYESGQNHSPQVLLDGYVDTAWVEGVSGYGSGEYVRIGFPAGTVVHGMGIVNGYQKSESLFWKNSAPSSLIVGSGNELYRVNLSAGYGYYEEFNLGSLVTDGSFYIIIENVRPGSAYKDTCISEIWLW